MRFLGRFRRFGTTQQPRAPLLLEPAAFALDVESSGVVQQTVEDGGGQLFRAVWLPCSLDRLSDRGRWLLKLSDKAASLAA